MNDIQLFYLLKQNVSAKYREAYPYYAGSLNRFGNREIAQFIDLLEKDCNARVSEKWIYTHLKPEVNNKLPRKDMLDILCQWLGYQGWDEFAHKNRNTRAETPETINTATANKRKLPLVLLLGAMLIVICIGLMAAKQQQKITVCYKDRYTQQEIAPTSITVYLIEGNHKKKLVADSHCYNLTYSGSGVLITESAYYKADTLTLKENDEPKIEITLQPDDYAMMLGAYMNGNIGDWNKRRTQLNDIIADDAMIQEVMFEDIGVEFLNKTEFINKVTIPGITNKNMEVIEVKYRDDKIVSLKFMQKGK